MNTRTITTYKPLTLKNGNQAIHAGIPAKKEYKLFINQSIDYSGDGYEWNIRENDFYNNLIVNPFERFSGDNDKSDFFDLIDNINNYVVEYDTLIYALEDVKRGVTDRDYSTMQEAISDLLGVEVSTYTTGKVRQALNRYYNSYGRGEDYEKTAALLTILTPYTWAADCIRGYCQGDWATILYPTELYTKEDIEYYEAFYFGGYAAVDITYRGETVTDFLTDNVVWDYDKLINTCLDIAGLPQDFNRDNIVYSKEA